MIYKANLYEVVVNKLLLLLFVTVIASTNISCTTASDQLEIKIGHDVKKNIEVTLENSKIKCKFAEAKTWLEPETNLQQFILKDKNQDQVQQPKAVTDRHLDGMHYSAKVRRGTITNAKIICDSPEVKTVHLEWAGGKSISNISIFKDEPYLKIDYIKYGVNIVDIASPGQCDNHSATYEIYGAEKYNRDYVLYPKVYFNQSEADMGKDEVDNPEPLSYKGYFIIGIYNKDNSTGFGRVVPVKNIDIIKLLFDPEKHPSLGIRGFELFPNYQRQHEPFSSYLFGVTQGPEQTISIGKELVGKEISKEQKI